MLHDASEVPLFLEGMAVPKSAVTPKQASRSASREASLLTIPLLLLSQKKISLKKNRADRLWIKPRINVHSGMIILSIP